MTPGSIGSTPASHAPTPLSTSFKDAGSGHPTPTSATGPKATKKKKNDDDSEPDSAQVGKKRTTFGAGRK
jgi:chromatin modification-related protein EAF6